MRSEIAGIHHDQVVCAVNEMVNFHLKSTTFEPWERLRNLSRSLDGVWFVLMVSDNLKSELGGNIEQLCHDSLAMSMIVRWGMVS